MEPFSSSIPAIDTTLARVIQMVEQARKNRPPSGLPHGLGQRQPEGERAPPDHEVSSPFLLKRATPFRRWEEFAPKQMPHQKDRHNRRKA